MGKRSVHKEQHILLKQQLVGFEDFTLRADLNHGMTDPTGLQVNGIISSRNHAVDHGPRLGDRDGAVGCAVRHPHRGHTVMDMVNRGGVPAQGRIGFRRRIKKLPDHARATANIKGILCRQIHNAAVVDDARGPAIQIASTANASAPDIGLQQSVLYSDYNSYGDPAKAWLVNGRTVPLSKLPETQDRQSRGLKAAYAVKEGALALGDRTPFLVGGALGKGVGLHQDVLKATLHMTAPVVHSVSATTAG